VSVLGSENARQACLRQTPGVWWHANGFVRNSHIGGEISRAWNQRSRVGRAAGTGCPNCWPQRRTRESIEDPACKRLGEQVQVLDEEPPPSVGPR